MTFQRIPRRIVISTAIASFILSGGMILMGQPLYMIALFALLPWMPVMLFESLWKIEHYSWLAIFGVVVVLQLGHVTEHLVQVGVLRLTPSTLVCPPPVDNAVNAQRAIEAGLRDPGINPTGHSASVIVKPGPDGQAMMNASGLPVTAPPACGVFGQLDLEIVHLIWEVAGWLLAMALVVQFPRNRWLWVSAAFASFHTVEHLFICYTFFFDPTMTYEGARQIWATVASGNIVTAYPLRLDQVAMNFYDVAGRFGILAKNGLVGSFFPEVNQYLADRPTLHLYYNSIVTLPMLVGFVVELRRSYDRYLGAALPRLKTEELVAVTPSLSVQRFKAGEEIITQGELADNFYIIAKGEVKVFQRMPDGQERVVNTIRTGEFFGEIGLLRDGYRWATVRAATPVELMRMDRDTFNEMMGYSIENRVAIEQIMEERAGNRPALGTA